MASSKHSRHSPGVLALPLLILSRLFSSTLPGILFFSIDYIFQILLLFQIGYTANQSGQRIVSNDNIPRLFWPWYFCQWAFVCLTWAYGYIGLSPKTPSRHFYAAIVRLGFCSASVGYFVLARKFVLVYWIISFYVACAWLLSICHLCGAIKRIRLHQQLQQDGKINPRNNFINLMTGSKMKYLSNQEQEEMKLSAIEAVSSNNIGKDEFWYHPQVLIETNQRDSRRKYLGYQSLDQVELVDDPLVGHFSPCHCCLPTDSVKRLAVIHDGPPMSSYKQNRIDQWQIQRSQFLDQPASHHRSVVISQTDESLENFEGNAYRPHVFCQKCSLLCNSSLLIELARGWALRTYLKYLLRIFTWEPQVEECFEHWSTPTALQKEARDGCHLCTIMWQTLSKEQQEELLLHDSELGSQLNRELSRLSGNESEQESLRARLHSRRCVRVKIQSPWAQKRWIKSWEHRHLPYALRLIPHFGQQRVARRWMKRKFACRAVSIDEDPTLSWDLETVDAIEIVSTHPSKRGPIVLPLSSSTSSTTTMAFINSWLQAHAHSKFVKELEDYDSEVDDTLPGSIGLKRSKSEIGFLPSRLLDVGTTEQPTVRIRLRNEIQHEYQTAQSRATNPDYRYIAFSHCWGKHKFATLQQATLSEFRRNIPTEILAQTFKDAVSTTRALGLRFVWIDSFCIIQNSADDWQKEAASMKDVYTNAYFVLASTKSWGSTESFFAEQNPLAMTPCLLATRNSTSESGSRDNAQRSFGCVYAFPQDKYTFDAERDLDLSRLKSRAWCYQELALGKRIVYFADHQVILECKDTCKKRVYQAQWKPMDVVKSYPHLLAPDILRPIFNMTGKLIAQIYRELSLPRWMRRRGENQVPNDLGDDTSQRQKNRQELARHDALPHVLLKEQWWLEVYRFSSCLLTMEKDKLQALAGIAARYQAQVNAQYVDGQYLAGLWQSPFLLPGLLWYVSQRRQNSRPQDYRAPSWSWASVDGTISNNSLEAGVDAEFSGISILEATVVGPGTEDMTRECEYPLGTCAGGSLLVQGVLKKAKIKVLSESERKYYVGHSGSKRRVTNEGDLGIYVSLSSDPTSGPLVHALECESEPGITIGHLVPDVESDIPDEVHCLQIIVKPDSISGQEDFGIPWVTRGLALTRVDSALGTVVNEYRRIGYIELEHTLGGVTIPNTFSLPWNSAPGEGAIRSPAPNIDVTEFFRYAAPQEVRIV